MTDPRIELWRRRAEESFEHAARESSEEDRRMWRRIAEHWLDLANRLETHCAKQNDEP